MIKIDINEVLALDKRYDEINHIQFDKIIWMDGDKELEVRNVDRNTFMFCGLNNTDFISRGFYLGTEDWNN
jgi:hypothetical protein